MKILLLRNISDQININNYNVQEIGLAKALVRKGHKCDIVLFTKEEKYRKERIKFNMYYITIHWVKGLNFYHNAIYIKLINDKFFDNYDIIQTHEYNQFMTYLLPYITKTKMIIYHGPYNDIKNKLAQKVFDLLFLSSIKKHYSNILTKSKLSQEYLLDKGFINIKTVGVGLDIEKFNDTISFEKSTFFELKNKIGDKPTLLYIGKIEERRNIEFLLKTLFVLKKKMSFNFLLIGDGETNYKNKCLCLIKEYELEDTIIYIKEIKQNEIKYAYGLSNLFVFPSKYEIYGMVLLESLYFNCPVLSSHNGGASVLLPTKYPEMIINSFDVDEWVDRIEYILRTFKYNDLNKYIKQNFTWDSLSIRFLEIYKESLK